MTVNLTRFTMKKYAVVLFTETDQPAVVPRVWVKDGDKLCYFPSSSMSDAQFNKAMSECTAADPSWQDYPCHIMHETGYYN